MMFRALLSVIFLTIVPASTGAAVPWQNPVTQTRYDGTSIICLDLMDLDIPGQDEDELLDLPLASPANKGEEPVAPFGPSVPLEKPAPVGKIDPDQKIHALGEIKPSKNQLISEKNRSQQILTTNPTDAPLPLQPFKGIYAPPEKSLNPNPSY
jgi:hypothetical protein